MRGLSYLFFLSATLYVLAGMFLGIAMAASGDHSLASTHAHLNLVGWVSMALFAVFYHIHPDAARTRLARVHFATATLGLWTMVPGIVLATHGKSETLAIAGSFLTLASMLVFAVMMIRAGFAGPAVPRTSVKHSAGQPA